MPANEEYSFPKILLFVLLQLSHFPPLCSPPPSLPPTSTVSPEQANTQWTISDYGCLTDTGTGNYSVSGS